MKKIFFDDMIKLKYLLFICLLISKTISYGQQFVDKKYTYDSILDLEYGKAENFAGQQVSLKMDIYMPKCDDITQNSKKPLLLVFHGGAFIAGSKNDASVTYICKEYAKRGYITATVGYRLGFVSDDKPWTCNYPNYSCVFATDTAEWYRAYYRGVQDGKGALRYLINRHKQYRIDSKNVFVIGESAGAFLALGLALFDTSIEKMAYANALNDAPIPHSITNSCKYNSGITFSNPIPRPDLGSINGSIEPSTENYIIKGIGNIFGAMPMDLLKNHNPNKPKPAIYSFHQPCDMIVPIDSGQIFEGLSWCMTNGYQCYAIANTGKVYGSRAFSNWNTSKNYGYTIKNEFTSTNFPYQFLLGAGSCADQVNKPCHSYDNITLRHDNLAKFFAPMVSTNPICDTAKITIKTNSLNVIDLQLYPNPITHKLNLRSTEYQELQIDILNHNGQLVMSKLKTKGFDVSIDVSTLNAGLYVIQIKNNKGETYYSKFEIK